LCGPVGNNWLVWWRGAGKSGVFHEVGTLKAFVIECGSFCRSKSIGVDPIDELGHNRDNNLLANSVAYYHLVTVFSTFEDYPELDKQWSWPFLLEISALITLLLPMVKSQTT
jgi:hypothetical protein